MVATWDVWRGKSRSGGKPQISVIAEGNQLIFPNSIYMFLTTGMHAQLGCICLKEGDVFWGRTVCIKLSTELSHVDTTRTSGVVKLSFTI